MSNSLACEHCLDIYYWSGAGPPGIEIMCHLISYNISHSLHDELSDNVTF